MAFKTTLQNPPDGKAHHTFNITTTPGEGHRGPEPNGRTGDHKTKAKFSRLTYSTLLRYITGHAFTGSTPSGSNPFTLRNRSPAPAANPYKQLSMCSPNARSTQPHAVGISLPSAGPERYPNSSPIRSASKKYFRPLQY